jgi:hypothetical protein
VLGDWPAAPPIGPQEWTYRETLLDWPLIAGRAPRARSRNPLVLLGPSPSWYESETYRSRVVRDPRSVVAEFDYHVPTNVTINVCDANTERATSSFPNDHPH